MMTMELKRLRFERGRWKGNNMNALLNAVRLAILLPVALIAATAHAAGFRMIEVPADADHPAIKGAMWYPCAEPAGKIDLAGMTIAGTKDCPIEGKHLPLVVISHGNLGAYFDHHDTAAALADAGFVVAAINHRGDNIPALNDAADPSVMFERPYAIIRLIDFMLSASPAAPHIDRNRIGFFGFSAGGSTGLELAGAEPNWGTLMCRFSPEPRACTNTLQRDFRLEAHPADPRIKTAVLADPGALWIVPESLSKVRIPIQLWASENAGRGLRNIAIQPGSVQALAKRLPISPEFHLVPNAGHFAFMLCGPSISPVPEYCTDAPGFDRAAFHNQFNAEVVRYFRQHLMAN
jgi:predicted dienelactone hydrolase